jgi:hypothetical protein
LAMSRTAMATWLRRPIIKLLLRPPGRLFLPGLRARRQFGYCA